MLSLLRHMVEMESPSDNKAAVDRMGAFLAEAFERLGGKVTFYPQEAAGNHLKAEFAGGASGGASDRASGKPVLLLGHFDTVWPMGTLAKMPFHIQDGRAFGPGVYDMKAGIAMMIFASARAERIRRGAPACNNLAGYRRRSWQHHRSPHR